MTQQELIAWGTPLVLSAVAGLVAGKAVRRLFLLPFEWLARKTVTTLDDQLVADAEEDLGIKPTKFDGDGNGPTQPQ